MSHIPTRIRPAQTTGLGGALRSCQTLLLGSVWKPIEELRKEGETGRKKINEYTRYLTVGLCLVQSWFYVRLPDGRYGWVMDRYTKPAQPVG